MKRKQIAVAEVARVCVCAACASRRTFYGPHREGAADAVQVDMDASLLERVAGTWRGRATRFFIRRSP